MDLENHNESVQHVTTKLLSLFFYDVIRALEKVLQFHLSLTTETTFADLFLIASHNYIDEWFIFVAQDDTRKRNIFV